jgi:hypothetical protein
VARDRGEHDELLWHPQEHAVQERKAPQLRDLLRMLFDQYAPATRELLGEERIAWLRRLPDEYCDRELALVHASPGDLWRAPQPDAENAELAATYGRCDARLVVYGHIHCPYIRNLDGLIVAKSGSVGSMQRRGKFVPVTN